MNVELISVDDQTVVIGASGRIDANNAEDFKKAILAILEEKDAPGLTIDIKNLEYISSAGLRALLFVAKKKEERIKITNTSEEVYEIFEVTNFTQIFDVE